MVEVSFHNRDTGLGSLRVEDGYSVLPMGVQYGDCYAADFHGELPLGYLDRSRIAPAQL